MNAEKWTCDSILTEAEKLGREAPIDPINEMASPESLPSRGETMRLYFTKLTNDLMTKFETLGMEARGGTSEEKMRKGIVDSLEKGFEALMGLQSSYQHTKGLQHEITEELKFSREVFQTIKEPQKTFPERLQFTGGQIDYRLPGEPNKTS